MQGSDPTLFFNCAITFQTSFSVTSGTNILFSIFEIYVIGFTVLVILLAKSVPIEAKELLNAFAISVSSDMILLL